MGFSLLNAAVIAVQKNVGFQIRSEELPKVGNEKLQARKNCLLILVLATFSEVGDAVDP